jgi:hypothetical protein
MVVRRCATGLRRFILVGAATALMMAGSVPGHDGKRGIGAAGNVALRVAQRDA